MKRIMKNVISIFIVIVMGVLMYFTMNYVRRRSQEIMSNDMSTSVNSNDQQKFLLKSSNNRSKSADTDNNNKENKPEGGPSGDAPSTTVIQSADDDLVHDEIIRLQKNMFALMYFFMFAAESLVLSLIVVYLIMSRFNKKDFGETFSGSISIVIYIVSVIVMTASVTYVDKVITDRYFLSECEVYSIEKDLQSDNLFGQNDGEDQSDSIESEKRNDVKTDKRNAVKKNEEDTTVNESAKELPYAQTKGYLYVDSGEDAIIDDYEELKPIEKYVPQIDIKRDDTEQDKDADKEASVNEEIYGGKKRESSYMMLN